MRKAQTYSFGAVFGEQTESENDCIKQHPLRFPKGCPEPGLSPHDASNGLKAGGDGGERDAMKEKAKLFYLEPQEFYFSSKEKETIIHTSCGPSPSLLCPRYAIVFLLFPSLGGSGSAPTEEDRGPQQVENFYFRDRGGGGG